jgi:hypothetical protein
MSSLTVVYNCKGAVCGWSGTAADVTHTAGGAPRCPACRAAVTSSAVDREREQQALGSADGSWRRTKRVARRNSTS